MIEKCKIFMKTHLWMCVAVLAVLMIVILLFESVIPLVNEVNQLKDDMKNKNRRIEQIDRQNNNIQDVETSYVRMKDRISQLVFNQNQDTRTSHVLNLISSAAKRYDIRIQSMKPDPVITGTYRVEMPIRLTLSGRYHNLGLFLNCIENADLIVKVEKLFVKSKTVVSPWLHVDMTICVFYLRRDS